MKTGWWLPLLVPSVLWTATGFADDKAVCLSAASKGQTLRDAHKLIEAREQLRLCAAAQCPAVVQSDCAGWLADVERVLPTVVLSAKDAAGRDLVDVVKVSLDGQPLASVLDGQAVPVDPGMHTFRFERADGSATTQQALVREGAKAQNVSAVLSGAEGSTGGTGFGEGGGSGLVAPTPRRPARVVGIVLAGVGVLGMGAGVGLALFAKSKDNQASGEAGLARQTDSTSAVNTGTAATVVLAAAAAVAAAGVIVWLTAPKAKVAVGTNGHEVLLQGSF